MNLLNKENIRDLSLFGGIFFSFSGYYAVLILLPNLGLGIDSRTLTMPLRLIIVIAFGIFFLVRPQIKLQKGLVFFLFFALAYLARILIEYFDFSKIYHIPVSEFFFYFMAFVLFPLLLISQSRFNDRNYNAILLTVISSSFILSILAMFLYKELLGVNVRISALIGREERLISPLALSNCSALCIGVGTSYLMANKVRLFKKSFICLTMGFSLIPFFLGASRGSILALAFPFLFYLIFSSGIKSRLKILLTIFVLSTMLILFTGYLGDAIFIRFFNTMDRIDVGTEGRIFLYKSSIYQFLENPIFGNSLNNDLFNYYPHNMLLEVMITTGVIGLIPFVLFLYVTFAKIIFVIREHKEYFWLCVFFMQAFTAGMFSGGIYAAAWFAIGAGMILGLNLNKRLHSEF